MTKKVLIITYYWPPAGGPGVQRVLKFAKYLPEFGWEPIILTVENGDYVATDTSLLSEVPEQIKVFRTKTIEPFSVFKKLSRKNQIDTYVLNNQSDGLLIRLSKYLRANLFIPDARIGWKYFAIRTAKKIIREEQPALIFSTSPPHSVQLIAKKIAQKSGLKWVADFRDPWVNSYTNQNLKRSKRAIRRDIHLEKSVLKSANQITLASADFYPLFQIGINNWKELTNGFDIIIQSKSTNQNQFTIAYAGSMSENQIPHAFLHALSKYRSLDFVINYYGNAGRKFLSTVAENGLSDKIISHGYVPKVLLLEKLQTNSILLLLMQPYQNGKDNIPLKLFDYLAANRFILAFGNPHGRTAEILKETKSGVVFPYNSEFGQKELEQIIYLCKNFNPIREALEKYNITETTKELAEIFVNLIENHG